MSEQEKPEHRWCKLGSSEMITSSRWFVPGTTYYRCPDCGHYAKSDSVPGPCPPSDGSEPLLN